MYEARRQRSSWARIKLSIVRKVYIHSPYLYGYSDLIFVVLEIIRVLPKLWFAFGNFVTFRSSVSLKLASSARFAYFTLPKISSFVFELTSFLYAHFLQSARLSSILLSMCSWYSIYPEFSSKITVYFPCCYFIFQFRFVSFCTLVITILHHSVRRTLAERRCPLRTFPSYRFNNSCQQLLLHFVTCWLASWLFSLIFYFGSSVSLLSHTDT